MAEEIQTVRGTRLTHREYFLLADWMRTNAEILKRERPGFIKVAEMASTALNFPVSTGSIRGVRKDMGIDWEPKNSGADHNKSRANRKAIMDDLDYIKAQLNRLEESNKEMGVTIARQQAAIHQLAKEYGVKLSSDFGIMPVASKPAVCCAPVTK